MSNLHSRYSEFYTSPFPDDLFAFFGFPLRLAYRHPDDCYDIHVFPAQLMQHFVIDDIETCGLRGEYCWSVR